MTAVLQMKQIDVEAIRHQLMQALQGTTTQTEVASKVGISRTAISMFLKGTYKGDNTEIAAKLTKWFDQQAQKEEVSATLPKTPDYVPTPTSERILATLTYAQAAQDLVIIYGGAGVGKTTTIAEYAENNNNVWVIESTPTRNTGGALLRAIAFTIGQRIPKGHADYLENALLDKLKGTDGLLIIDEAQFLNDRALENARRIAEMSGIGLAFVGNENVYGQLTGKRRAADYAQLFSRIGKRVRLTRPADKDVEVIAKEWNLGKDEIELAKHIASKPGALRGLNKTLRLATVFAAGQSINQSHIRAAWKDLSGE